MNRVSIFIDGGHYNAIQKFHRTNFNFESFIAKVLEHLNGLEPEVSHIFYYDCLPYIDKYSTSDDLATRQKHEAYFNYLRSRPGVLIREGMLRKRNSTVVQKRVDLLLGLDIAEECRKGVVTNLILVAGDEDFAPAIEHASKNGIAVWLVHAPKDCEAYADSLWNLADYRIAIDGNFASSVARDSSLT
jgi:uncharacterized LabA/DUF88 family protein